MSKPVITPDDRLKQTARHIRPYRHAIFSIVHPASEEATIVINYNEFGEGLLKGISVGPGLYEIQLNTSSFKNVERVFGEASIAHTALPSPVCSSYFNTTTRELFTVLIFDAATFTTVDIEGEILVTIKEFYE